MANPKIKSAVRKQITDGKLALKEIMQRNLAAMADAMIAQVVARLKRLPPSQQFQAIVNIDQPGTLNYKQELQEALAIIAADAIEQARKEVPKAKAVKLMESLETIKLGEFDDLPPKLKSRVQKTVQLTIDTQASDLNKNIGFQFNHSVDSTESEELIGQDLSDAAEDYLDGPATEAGASTLASQTVNESRSYFFADDDVAEQIEAFEFVNGDPVTEICQDLAGTIFSKDDIEAMRYIPPLHFNCKSFIVPILVGNLGDREVESLRPSTQRIADTIQFAEHTCCANNLKVET